MCAILDADVVHEVFGSSQHPAGKHFLEWVDKGSQRLVIGGKLTEELYTGSKNFRFWQRQAQLAGKIRIINKAKVDAREKSISGKRICKSNDPHIIALAQISRARLLYSNDKKLHADFQNKELIDEPRGKVYSTLKHESLHDSHQGLLKKKGLCKAQPDANNESPTGLGE